MQITSFDGFHDASKMIARFAPIKSIPRPPAFVERRKSLPNTNTETNIKN